jgi:diguanylate cyclase (GGDEF)-like protein
MTISTGVSAGKDADTGPTQIFSRADEKLYQAKKAGRNRVCM